MSLDNKLLDELFQSAAQYLSISKASQRLETKAKLEIYGLYKVVMDGPKPSRSRPSIFDQVGRAKWDSWSDAGTTWSDESGRVKRGAAQSRYLEIAQTVGWNVGEAGVSSGQSVSSTHDQDDQYVDLDRLDESDEASPPSNIQSSGMGTRVSIMTLLGKPGSMSESLHDSAAVGDLVELKRYLEGKDGCNVNGQNSDGYTALHLASDRGHLEAVNLLVGAKADLDIKDPDGLTARELAEMAGHEDVAKRLQAERSDSYEHDLHGTLIIP